MKKRIVSFLLALVMAVSLLPVSAFAAEDAPFVLKADGQAVAVEKTPITGYTVMYNEYLLPIYKATITESTRVLDISDIANTAVASIMDSVSGKEYAVASGSASVGVEKLESYPVTNTDFNTAVFILEGGKAITDVIDTTAKKTPFLLFYDSSYQELCGLILEIKEDPAPAEDESEFPYKGTPVVTYTKAGDADESTAVLKRIGTRTWHVTFQQDSITKGKTWLVSLPAGATINDVNFGDTVNQ